MARPEHKTTLPAFSKEEYERAKVFLATQVASMLGRKLEEGDWSKVYCFAKRIPMSSWSNLHIDISYRGLGVEHKLLRCGALGSHSIKTICGTTRMHPAATRSIRIDDLRANADAVMRDVFRQYAELIKSHAKQVKKDWPEGEPDMRIGWLLWEDLLTEFLYFEQPMISPDPAAYKAEWNETPAKGIRKASKSLWIFDKKTGEKRYSVTTSAGIKIQPYFDVPPPSDPNLYYFRVQSESIDADTVQIWVSASTAHAIERLVGSLDMDQVSDAILKASRSASEAIVSPSEIDGLAKPIRITYKASEVLRTTWKGVSDEDRARQFIESLQST